MSIIAGVDEVGRGCWAGPLVAGAVVLPKNFASSHTTWQLCDSKKLSAKQRTVAAKQLERIVLDYSLGWVTAQEIDEVGLTAAVRLAMQRAVEGLSVVYDMIIIDGNYNFLSDNPNTQSLIKADDQIPAVSAASIMAKVARDAYMHRAAKKFPNYGFERHVGYGTKLHIESLVRYGPSILHRMSYKPIMNLRPAA